MLVISTALMLSAQTQASWLTVLRFSVQSAETAET